MLSLHVRMLCPQVAGLSGVDGVQRGIARRRRECTTNTPRPGEVDVDLKSEVGSILETWCDWNVTECKLHQGVRSQDQHYSVQGYFFLLENNGTVVLIILLEFG